MQVQVQLQSHSSGYSGDQKHEVEMKVKVYIGTICPTSTMNSISHFLLLPCDVYIWYAVSYV